MAAYLISFRDGGGQGGELITSNYTVSLPSLPRELARVRMDRDDPIF
jgi:hypothetical protein